MNQSQLTELLTNLIALLNVANQAGINVMEQVTERLKNLSDNKYFHLADGHQMIAPNEHEIDLGKWEGKLMMIKEYKNRTNATLMNAKHVCEEYFEKQGLAFYVRPY